MERLPKPLHASVRRALRQAWELDDADKAEKLIRNLARRLERDAPGVAASILEGLDEILTVRRLGLPTELRRSLACTNIIENMMGTVRRVCRNVKRWRSAAMALRWTAAAMLEASQGLPPAQGSQAAPPAACGPSSASGSDRRRSGHCRTDKGRVTFNRQHRPPKFNKKRDIPCRYCPPRTARSFSRLCR